MHQGRRQPTRPALISSDYNGFHVVSTSSVVLQCFSGVPLSRTARIAQRSHFVLQPGPGPSWDLAGRLVVTERARMAGPREKSRAVLSS